MEAQSLAKPLSCISCAKRKVRCDRLEPCAHCKRRGDTCHYPTPIGISGEADRDDSLLKAQRERIDKLEQYILKNGGDLNQFLRTPDTESKTTKAPAIPSTASINNSTVQQGVKRSHDGTPHAQQITYCPRPQAVLVEHEKQTTYIEAPMWYSWSEAKRTDTEAVMEVPQPPSHVQELHNIPSMGYIATLIDSPIASSEPALYLQHPSLETIRALWMAYLKNVHPIVKIFFDWDKATLVDRAACDPANLSRGEQCLVFAIYFITVLSLSDSQCSAMFDGAKKSALLSRFQISAEGALTAANYTSVSDLLILQGFILYILAMRERAKPATISSLMGIAVRMGERMGLHRDGSLLSLTPMQIEERRRIWWQMQHMEILLGMLLGCISTSLYADWDTKLPGNYEDDDIQVEMELLPPERPGLTSTSYCLWRYYVLYIQREEKDMVKGGLWMTSKQVGLDEKDALTERIKQLLSEKFLQHCELVNPLHVQIQIGIQALLLAMQRVARQPSIAGTRISEMSKQHRDELLKICKKTMECYIFAETTPSIAHFRWHNEIYFQYPGFVYVIMEAHHRANTSEATALWALISKVCELNVKLMSSTQVPEISAIGRLILSAWWQRQDHLQKQGEEIEIPWCVEELQRVLNIRPPMSDAEGHDLLLPVDALEFLDFDLIDWSIWETGRFL